MADVSPQCSSSNHGMCPGYYKTAHPCGCPCHKAVTEQQVTSDGNQTAGLLRQLHVGSRIPPKEQVGQLPRGNVMLDYLGHAAVTDILLAADPEWSWEPFAVDDNGLPRVMYDAGGKPRALWIRLTIHGHTRIGIGTCSSSAGDPYKELIGDALRNAAMRFGVALSLWAKEEWADLEAGEPGSQAGDRSSGGKSRGSAPGENDPQPGNVRTLPTPSDADVARHPSNGPALLPPQAIRVRARDLGLTEEEYRRAISTVSGGRTTTSTELEEREYPQAFKQIESIAKAKSRGPA